MKQELKALAQAAQHNGGVYWRRAGRDASRRSRAGRPLTRPSHFWRRYGVQGRRSDEVHAVGSGSGGGVQPPSLGCHHTDGGGKQQRISGESRSCREMPSGCAESDVRQDGADRLLSPVTAAEAATTVATQAEAVNEVDVNGASDKQHATSGMTKEDGNEAVHAVDGTNRKRGRSRWRAAIEGAASRRRVMQGRVLTRLKRRRTAADDDASGCSESNGLRLRTTWMGKGKHNASKRRRLAVMDEVDGDGVSMTTGSGVGELYALRGPRSRSGAGS